MTRRLTASLKLLLVSLLLTVATTQTGATTWHVAIDGSDDTGSGSYGAPFACIQYALDQAASGDTIEVGPGLYAWDGNSNLTFNGTSLTITSAGGASATAIDCEGSSVNPRRAMTFAAAIDSSFKVTGFTFKNGYMPDNGGLIYVNEGCAPVFENCHFELSESFDGGAVFLDSNSGGTFRNCTFASNNSDNLGGAVFAEAGSTTRFESCDFIDNSSESYGGVLMVGTGANAQFSECLFADADATWGGGVLYAFDASVTFSNCTFVKSAATWSGDVLAFSGSAITLENSLLHTTKGSEAIVCLGSSSISISCSNIYSTQYDGWFGCIAPQYGVSGNMAEDPSFVHYQSGDYRVLSDSPCSPENNSCGVVIGSEEVLEPVDDCGDLDGNGLISISDAVYAINYIFASGPAPVDSRGGDVDCNGQVSITDGVYIINYIFAYGKPPCADCP